MVCEITEEIISHLSSDATLGGLIGGYTGGSTTRVIYGDPDDPLALSATLPGYVVISEGDEGQADFQESEWEKDPRVGLLDQEYFVTAVARNSKLALQIRDRVRDLLDDRHFDTDNYIVNLVEWTGSFELAKMEGDDRRKRRTGRFICTGQLRKNEINLNDWE